MKTYYVNIGLDVNGQSDNDGTQEAQALVILAELCGLGSFEHRKEQSPYVTTDGQPRVESTIVAQLRTSYTLAELRRLIYRASVLLRQDCISLSYDNGRRGELVGPRTEDYGDFNGDYFRPY